MRNKKGFTLAELLIVVAIIAVLVAIAIPIFITQLEKAREATDTANIRSKYAEIMTQILTDDKNDCSATVTLEQGIDGWQNQENLDSLNKLAVTENAAKGIMGVDVSLDSPTAGQVVNIAYDADGGSDGLGAVTISLATPTP